MTFEGAAIDLVAQGVHTFVAPGSVGLLGWWLSGRFRKTEERADAKAELVASLARSVAESVAITARKGVEDHELIDQKRHVENRARLEKIDDKIVEISLSLARNGINGRDRST